MHQLDFESYGARTNKKRPKNAQNHKTSTKPYQNDVQRMRLGQLLAPKGAIWLNWASFWRLSWSAMKIMRRYHDVVRGTDLKLIAVERSTFSTRRKQRWPGRRENARLTVMRTLITAFYVQTARKTCGFNIPSARRANFTSVIIIHHHPCDTS